MANEYFKRTPTSTGNRKVFTWAGWVKKTENSGGFGRFFESGAVGNRTYFTYTDLDEPRFTEQAVNSNRDSLVSNYKLRDSSSICHVMIAVNSTLSNADDRVKIYINGSSINNHGFSTDDPPALNALFQHNEAGEVQYIGNSANQAADFQGYMSDVFHVDGQALTPDVFGFYKDGDGYQSSGTTQATDFRPGQWVPKSPSVIKNVINNSGGFGVNGFYLPMNDSSNPGADFHCDPNSIIKLKGEDLPQPRNGAPTTTDAYVSQLRSDPYAANIVLAVPGISISPNTELVTNGTFDTDVSGWTITAGSAPSSSISWVGGSVQITRGTGTGAGNNLSRSVTVEVGKSYVASVLCRGTVSGSQTPYLYVGTTAGNDDLLTKNRGSDFSGTLSGTFTATATTVYVAVAISNYATALFDNVSIREVEVPRDYSADIKGSGSNKTLTVSGNTGIGYELGGYYGSALSFPYALGQRVTTTSNDFAMGTGDFTVEVWINPDQVVNYKTIFSTRPDNGSYTDGFNMWINASGATGVYSNAFLTQTASNAIIPNQWTHVVAERYNNQLTTYINGVAAATATNTQNFTRTLAALGELSSQDAEQYDGLMQDLRVYKGVAKYKGGFDVPKPYTPVGIESWRVTTDTCSNNFATLNSLSYQTTGTYGTSYPVLSDGNLKITHGQTGQWERSNASFGVGEGKWYCEFQIVSRPTGGTPPNNSENWAVGVRESDSSLFYGETDGFENLGDHVYWIDSNTAKIVSNQDRSAGSTSGISNVVNGDIINIAFEKTATTLKVWFGINGTYFNSGNPSSGTTPAVNVSTTTQYIIPSAAFYQYTGQVEPVGTFNFGQNPSFSGQTIAGTNADDSGKGLFKYAPPTGFLALCEDNLPAPAIADPGKYFKSVLYTGDGSDGRSITGVGFKPDLVWTKERSSTSGHFLIDSVRGVTNFLGSHNNAIEGSSLIAIKSFDSSGYSIGNSGAFNETSQTYVAWCWKAGGAAVSNTDGTITSQVSANQTAGFSIATWTSTGSNDALQTVGHGLDTAPNMIILKNRDAAVNWRVYHSGINDGSKNSVTLNSTEAAYVFWPSVDDDTFGLANSTTTGQSSGASGQDIVAYCWTEIEGFSKFGSYIGNASADGPFVYCGFKPAWVMIKITTGTNSWVIYDSSRNSTNIVNNRLRANLSNIEDTHNGVDFLSNGFKLRDAGSSSTNAAQTYIFAAFAESPFQTANAK